MKKYTVIKNKRPIKLTEDSSFKKQEAVFVLVVIGSGSLYPVTAVDLIKL